MVSEDQLFELVLGDTVKLDSPLTEGTILLFRSHIPWRGGSITNIFLQDTNRNGEVLCLVKFITEQSDLIALNSSQGGPNNWGTEIWVNGLKSLFPPDEVATFSIEYYNNWYTLSVNDKAVGGMPKRWSEGTVRAITYDTDGNRPAFSSPISVAVVKR